MKSKKTFAPVQKFPKSHLFTFLTIIFLTINCFAQREFSVTEAVYDYCQMKRKYANELISKTPLVPQELEYAIFIQKELLLYLDKPEIRALAEIDMSIKSQRTDARFDLARSLLIAKRKEESLKILRELVDEASSGFYGELMQEEPFKPFLSEPEFKKVLMQFRAIDNFLTKETLKTPFQPNISEDEKIAGLSLFWSNAKYSFVYFDQLPELDWDKTFLEYLPKVRQTKSTYEYYRVLQELCARLKDGHTNVYLPQNLREEMETRPPLRTILVEDKVLIWKVFSESLRQQAIRTGVEVLKIDGVPVKEYAEKNVKPYQSSSTPQDLTVRTYTYALLAGAKDKPIEFELKNTKGEIFKRSVPRTGYSDLNPPNAAPLEFKILSRNIGYLALNSFETDKVVKDFIQNFESISKTDSLIIDIRDNGGGDSRFGIQILSYLTNQPFQTSRWFARQFSAKKMQYGNLLHWFGGNAETIQPNKEKFYDKPVVVLTGPRTFSAAEDFLVAFDYMKRGKIIGEATGGSTGQPYFFNLPGGGSARICSKKDTYPDGKRFVGIGIQPNIIVSPKTSDFVEGNDSVLDVALKELAIGNSKQRQ